MAKGASSSECLSSDDTWLDTDDPAFLTYVLCCVFLVCLGGVMSGLQQGMMQLDKPTLRTMKEEASPMFRAMLGLVEPLIRRRHLMLVTLLVANAAAMEALPIFMDVLVPKYVAIMMSVSMVVMFGEIIPQAVCLRWPGELACIFAPLVWFLLVLFLPITYPIAKLLDWMLGSEHHQMYSRAGLRELVCEQSFAAGHGHLTDDELDAITGTLDLHSKSAADVCIPIDRVFKLSFDATLTDKVLRDILDHGHSRVPIWKGREDNIVGLLMVKHLIRVDCRHEIPVRSLQILPAFVADERLSLFALLRRFRTGTSHMAVVVKPFGTITSAPSPRPRSTTEESEVIRITTVDQERVHAMGILTLEDVIEQLLKHEIEDETDVWKPVNSRLDDRLSQVRTLRSDLMSTLAGSQSASSSDGNGAQTEPLMGGAAEGSPGHHQSTTSYGSLNEFSQDSSGRASSPTLLKMLQEAQGKR